MRGREHRALTDSDGLAKLVSPLAAKAVSAGVDETLKRRVTLKAIRAGHRLDPDAQPQPLGVVLEKPGDIDAAMQHFTAHLAIRQDLVVRSPTDRCIKRSLGVAPLPPREPL